MSPENPETQRSDGSPLAVSVRGLTRDFGPLRAVNDLTLEVARGEIFGLVGPDGAGKTTVMRVLCGLVDPTCGEVEVAGFPVMKQAAAVRDRIGYMAQRFGLYMDLTVAENISFYADLFGLDPRVVDEKTRFLLELTRMAPFRERKAGQLSGGMKQKLALICSLLHEPELLILDEPTNGVDPVSRRDFWIILHQLVKKGITVLVSTSYLDEAERCNRVGLMHQGVMIVCDAPDRLAAQLRERCYMLQSSNPRTARAYLLERPDILSVEPSGSSLHLFLSPEQIDPGRLRLDLERRGIRVETLREIRPTVEDIFIALIRQRSQEAA